MKDITLFQPIYQERVWGGRGLQTHLGRSLPPGKLIGESWDISDRPEARSIIAGGDLKGLTLQQALEKHSDTLMGPDYPPGQPFPLLVKWLDCRQRLSLQVHPPAKATVSLGGESKTEYWYISVAEPEAKILVGLKKGVTRPQFEAALQKNTVESLVHQIPTSPGDSMFLQSGRLHAIDAGNLILEIQENSDTTYRVYDWDRPGLDGKPRQLHIEESLQCIDWSDFEPEAIHTEPGNKEQILASCPSFRIRKFNLKPGQGILKLCRREQARLIHVVTGCLREAETGGLLKKGDNALLPYEKTIFLEAVEDTVALLTDNFYLA